MIQILRNSLKADLTYHVREAKHTFCEATVTFDHTNLISLFVSPSEHSILTHHVHKYGMDGQSENIIPVTGAEAWILQTVFDLVNKMIEDEWTDIMITL